MDEALEDDAAMDGLLSFCCTQPAPMPRGADDRECTVCRLDASAYASSSAAKIGEQFLRDFVLNRKPVILTNCVAHWPALTRWTHAYLRGALGERPVHVARTPDGLADAVTRTHTTGAPYFAKAHEALMPFSAFLDAVESPLRDGASGSLLRAVHYCSHQNSSLQAEFEPLWADVELALPWADAAFGRPPEATNFWMGEDAARTTVHADLFDNLYVVVRGTKEFALLPPQEGAALERRPFRAGTYREQPEARGGLALTLDEPPVHVHWSAVDLESATHLRPVRASVHAGDLLYLPALWWHAVSQHGGSLDGDGTAAGATIAVNFWYEGPTLQEPCE